MVKKELHCTTRDPFHSSNFHSPGSCTSHLFPVTPDLSFPVPLSSALTSFLPVVTWHLSSFFPKQLLLFVQYVKFRWNNNMIPNSYVHCGPHTRTLGSARSTSALHPPCAVATLLPQIPQISIVTLILNFLPHKSSLITIMTLLSALKSLGSSSLRLCPPFYTYHQKTGCSWIPGLLSSGNS